MFKIIITMKDKRYDYILIRNASNLIDAISDSVKLLGLVHTDIVSITATEIPQAKIIKFEGKKK